MPTVTIDGSTIMVEPDTKIIQAADQLGIEIPRFCYHPDLRPEGNCRMCLVHVKGFARLTPACTTPVGDNMVVSTAHTHNKVREATQGVLEFLLINHPLDCPTCDQAGECSLQDFYLHPDYGLYHSDVDPNEKVRKHKALNLGPIYMDSERCVMCSRCVRFCNEVSETGELQFVQRGNHVEIQAFENRALDDPYAGNLADVCPVGALTSQDFRFKRRVWFLQHAESVCAGCSTGCNVRIDHADGRVERVVPRRNPAVNKSWMCDEGRGSFHRLENLSRFKFPLIRREGSLREGSWDEAIAAIMNATHVTTPGQAAFAASSSATNETLWLLREWGQFLNLPSLMDYRLYDEPSNIGALQDHLLRRWDKTPNAQGATRLGLGKGPGIVSMAEAAGHGTVQFALIVHYPPLVGPDNDTRLAALRRLSQDATFSVVLTNDQAEWWGGANVVLPITSWSEEDGTYTNFAGEVQAVQAAVAPPGQARPAWQILAELLSQTTESKPFASAEAVFDALALAVTEFAGLRYSLLKSHRATAYPPEGRMAYGQEGFTGH